MATHQNKVGLSYPLTKMIFRVTVEGVNGTATFNEVSGVETNVDVTEFRGKMPRANVSIELIDINGGSPQNAVMSITGSKVWVLTNAWVTKYSAPDLNLMANEVAIKSVELANEKLVIPN